MSIMTIFPDDWTAEQRREAVNGYAQDMDLEIALTFDGLDYAIIGLAAQFTHEPLVVYCYERIIEVLTETGLSHDEAIEHIGYNVEGAWVGPGTPLILQPACFEDYLSSPTVAAEEVSDSEQ